MVRDTTGKHPSYFEATLQLRDVSQEIIDYVEKEMVRVKLMVAKIIELKNGFDYYVSDNELARAIGKKLQTRFGGDYKVTSSLHTKKDSKNLYRVTILFREAHFRKKDKVIYRGEEYKVISMGKDIMLQETKTGKKIHVKYKEMHQIKKQESEE